MDPKFIPSKIVKHAPVGPLSRYIEPYVGLVREQGYTPASVHEHVRVIVMFSQYLQRSGCEIRDLDEAVVERFLSHELKEQYPRVWAPATLRRLLAMLRQMGATRGKSTALLKSCATAHGRLFPFSPGRTIALSRYGERLVAIHRQVPIRAFWHRSVEALKASSH